MVSDPGLERCPDASCQRSEPLKDPRSRWIHAKNTSFDLSRWTYIIEQPMMFGGHMCLSRITTFGSRYESTYTVRHCAIDVQYL